MGWYTINNIDELDTPALVVYPDRVRYNIDLVITMVDDVVRLRPHVKTHKSPDVTKLMLQAGISKFKCATIAEAEMLGMCKAPDVLLAYQPTGPKLKRFVKLIKAYPDSAFSCLVDNIQTAHTVAAEAVANDILMPVFIDLNVGMNRTGIPTAEAFSLYEEIAKIAGISIKGLHAYDGHIHDSDYALREQKFNSAINPVLALAEEIIAKGYPKPTVIAGGSPTFPISVKVKGIECSPGTFAYWDRGYQRACAEQEFQTAALVIGRVISLPEDGKVCIDIGHKSVSAENELSKRIYFLNAPDLVFTGQSEEHLVAEAGAGHRYKIGDVLYGLPYHICPTIALYERALFVKDQQVKGEWMNIARDRKITI